MSRADLVHSLFCSPCGLKLEHEIQKPKHSASASVSKSQTSSLIRFGLQSQGFFLEGNVFWTLITNLSQWLGRKAYETNALKHQVNSRIQPCLDPKTGAVIFPGILRCLRSDTHTHTFWHTHMHKHAKMVSSQPPGPHALTYKIQIINFKTHIQHINENSLKRNSK